KAQQLAHPVRKPSAALSPHEACVVHLCLKEWTAQTQRHRRPGVTTRVLSRAMPDIGIKQHNGSLRARDSIRMSKKKFLCWRVWKMVRSGQNIGRTIFQRKRID